jgi:hypothetical protein
MLLADNGRSAIALAARGCTVVAVDNDRKRLVALERVKAAYIAERADAAQLAQWAAGFGLGLTLFHGWPEFVEQVLFWSALPKFVGANQAVVFIHQRLIAVEAAPQSVALWSRLTT